MDFQIGVQLYTLRNEFKDAHTLSKIFDFLKEADCDVVELASLPNDVTAATLKKMSDDSGVRIISSHTGIKKLVEDIDRIADEHALMGAEYIGVGGMPQEYRTIDGASRFVDIYNDLAEKIADRNLSFIYHNHDFEFKKDKDGSCIYDVLLDKSGANVTFCLDAYWAKYAKVDVCECIDKIGDRLAILHLKDMKKRFLRKPTMTAPGQGSLDLIGYMKQCEQYGTKYALVEVDKTKDARKAVLEGIAYLKSNQ